MIRVLVVGAHVAVLSFVYLAVAVLEAGFTPQGIPANPSRVSIAIFVMRSLNLDGAALLGIIKVLILGSLVTASSALLAATPTLRPLRWVGVGSSLAALGYVLYTFPNIAAMGRVPWPLFALAGLFLASALLLAVLPARQDAGATQAWAALFLWVFGGGGVALLAYGMVSNPLTTQQFAVASGCTLAHAGVYYCLVRCLGGKNKKVSSERMLLLLIPLAVAGVGLVYAMPLALAVAAGLVVYATATI